MANRSTTDERKGRPGRRPGARPEPALVAPVVTDATAPALLGMSARAFRDAVARQRIPHVRIGARVVVLVADLGELARAPARDDASGVLPRDDDAELDVDAVLASVGRRRA